MKINTLKKYILKNSLHKRLVIHLNLVNKICRIIINFWREEVSFEK